jgi:hypothetical protein
MILYRARSLSSRPRRLPAYEGNEPFLRIRGRWFTSVVADAIAYGAATFRTGNWELVCIDVPDAIVDGFRVATTPYTVDGLAPIDYADKPETEYVVQTFRVMDAQVVAMNDQARIRDVIDVHADPSPAMVRMPVPQPLPLAA